MSSTTVVVVLLILVIALAVGLITPPPIGKLVGGVIALGAVLYLILNVSLA